MEVQAYIKHIKISPKKLRFLVTDIKSKTPQEALELLPLSSKRGANFLYKAIQSAVSNAKTRITSDIADLRFKEILVESGAALKRYRAASKGRANTYKRRSSHIKVVLVSDNKRKVTTVKPVVDVKKVNNQKK
ncbi:50S ribosomal protein L22 [Candidatus Roizmanbacteria bacterium RIFCSPLOWO2_02_FULL_38_10]|uniref:Large ribosomal subunit protein uL22 n=1 Tax=Candidatus Roizmanbacteria bacterium RIFCSPLOWO2_02_FULL_38_10 TaxID=1802074 RepID=A0A1F7JK97_9BACT|nr:MAG: 50S ribosomal protein L22 [Candidatus Roizmanbacteria bacterium RIFCSPLOWO2_02_FULL_38_10]